MWFPLIHEPKLFPYLFYVKKTIRKEIDDVIKQIKDFQKKQAVIDAEFEAKTKDAIAAAV